MPCDSGDFDDDYSVERRGREAAERALCEARWLLLRVIGGRCLIGRVGRIAEKHRRAQLAHRRADRRDRQAEHRMEIDDAKTDIREVRQRGGVPGARLMARVERATAEIARLRDMTDAELLRTYWGHK